MKKSGFTISELLVALGIIAVAAALVGPIFSNIIPDKNKMKVISYYNKINEINQKLLSDKNLYPTKYEIDGNGEQYISVYGLANKERPVDDSVCDYVSHCGDAFKYAAFLAYAMIGKNKDNQFEYDDGSYWIIKHVYHYGTIPLSVDFTITIYVDGYTTNACTYNPSSCKKPDKFIFKVDENGAVRAGDAMTDAYLTNMTTVNNQKADRKLAEEYFGERNYNN